MLFATVLIAVAVGFEFKLGGFAFGRESSPDHPVTIAKVSELVEAEVTNRMDSVASVPAGAVVAFDGVCPPGWAEYRRAEGRFVLGVGQGSLKTSAALREQGGSETHTLTVRELPKHSHRVNEDMPKLQRGFGSDRERWNAHLAFGNEIHPAHGIPMSQFVGIEEAGGGEPHNNMPPYIALYFCKKEG